MTNGEEKLAGVLFPSIKDWALTRGAVKNTIQDLARTSRHLHANKAHREYLLRKAEEAVMKAKAADPGFLGRMKESLMERPAINNTVSSLNSEVRRAMIREQRRQAARKELFNTLGIYEPQKILTFTAYVSYTYLKEGSTTISVYPVS